MNVFIHVKGNNPIRIAWPVSCLPRIGEHLFIYDFYPDVKVLEDTLVVQDIQWHVVNGETCTSLFLGYDPIEDDQRDIKSMKLN